MSRIRTLALPVVVLCTLFAVAGCKKKAAEPVVDSTPTATVAAPAPAPAPAELPPPPDAGPAGQVTAVDVGSAVGSDLRVGIPKSTFAPKDRIMASVVTKTPDLNNNTPTKLTARWSHVDSNQVINEESRDITLKGEQVFAFEVKNPQPWPTGKYRLEVMLGGKAAQTRDFEVK